MKAEEFIKNLDFNHSIGKLLMIAYMEGYAKLKLIEFTNQLTISEFLHEKHIDVVEHFLNKTNEENETPS